MGLFDKIKKEEILQDNQQEEPKNMNIDEMSNYVLSDIRKEDLNNDFDVFPISKLVELSPLLGEMTNKLNSINEIIPTSKNKMYKVTNLKGGTLAQNKKTGQFYGSIIGKDKNRTMATFKEVNPKNVKLQTLNPEVLMMTVALAGIEAELGEIKEISKNIMSFLEHDKESKIESDLEILNKFMKEYKYNFNDNDYKNNIHSLIIDISRSSNSDIVFYKKELKDILTKTKLITTNISMKSIIERLKDKFKYYRLSLYIYSYATFSEVIVLKNNTPEFLKTKIDELKRLVSEYNEVYEKSLDYVRNNANKSLEGNILNGIGTAGKAIGNLAEKVKAKNVDNWLNEKGSNLKQSGQNIKDDYSKKFEEVKETYTNKFIEGIEKIYISQTNEEIYFDNENIYIRTKSASTK